MEIEFGLELIFCDFFFVLFFERWLMESESGLELLFVSLIQFSRLMNFIPSPLIFLPIVAQFVS